MGLSLVPNRRLGCKLKPDACATQANALPHLRKLQPAERAGCGGGYHEVPLGRYPRFHGLQLARCQVSGMVLDKVALELVCLEVEMH